MEIIISTFWGLAKLLGLVFVIVVPLMMILEISREFKALDLLTRVFYPLVRWIGFKKDSIYPLLAGVIFGISYGGGVLIGESNSGRIDSKQRLLIALFLGVCHAIIEDTLLFVAQGADWLILIVTRFILAIIVVFGANLVIKENVVKK